MALDDPSRQIFELGPIPADVHCWRILLNDAGWMLILSVTAIFLGTEAAKAEPNEVLRDDGTPSPLGPIPAICVAHKS